MTNRQEAKQFVAKLNIAQAELGNVIFPIFKKFTTANRAYMPSASDIHERIKSDMRETRRKR